MGTSGLVSFVIVRNAAAIQSVSHHVAIIKGGQKLLEPSKFVADVALMGGRQLHSAGNLSAGTMQLSSGGDLDDIHFLYCQAQNTRP